MIYFLTDLGYLNILLWQIASISSRYLQFVWDIDFVASVSHWTLEGDSLRLVSSWNLFEGHLIFADLNKILDHML